MSVPAGTNKSIMNLLERMFNAEVNRALDKSPEHKHWPLLPQLRKSKTLKRAIEEGLIVLASTVDYCPFGALTINGYELTHLGRLLYCISPDEAAP